MELDFAQGTLTLSLRLPDGGPRSVVSGVAALARGQQPEGVPLGLRLERADRQRLRLVAQVHGEATLVSCAWSGRLAVAAGTRLFMNGYQSWTDGAESPLWARTRSMGPVGRLVEKSHHLSAYGDYGFAPQARRRGQFAGWTYAWFRKPAAGGAWSLLASLADRGAFTHFWLELGWLALLRARLAGRQAPVPARLTVSRDLEGRRLDPAKEREFVLLDLACYEGGEAEVFDRWFADQGIRARTQEPCRGWTSWYKYYEDIDSAKIRRALRGFAAGGLARGRQAAVFQIDDGWQSRVGDWLSVRTDRFPEGMAALAAEIKDQGLVPGLWLAPFAAHVDSELARAHPDWLVRDPEGRAPFAGSNWGGFHGLDLLLPAVQDHLRAVFRTVFDEWGFQLVKLDFLYALCLLPRQGLSRGEIMAFGMDFLRSCAGDRRILACGVPLASAFGVVDYCRIGCDVGLDWNGKLVERLAHRERVSTRNSLDNTRGRRHLNGRAFLNDPDVWIGRSGKDVRLSPAQKEILHRDNLRYGGLVFCSDDWEEIPPAWREW